MTEQQRRPGEWPIDLSGIDDVTDELEERRSRGTSEAARFEMVRGSIRAQLEAQPSPRCVRAAARRWHELVTAVADDVEKQLRRTG